MVSLAKRTYTSGLIGNVLLGTNFFSTIALNYRKKEALILLEFFLRMFKKMITPKSLEDLNY